MSGLETRIGLLAAALALLATPAAAEMNLRSHLDLGEVARCIANSGATFYGAHWCPVCRRQMEAFGEHAGALPYVECYDGSKRDGMNGSCRSQRISRFPTWVFPDGTASSGLRSPVSLAAATGCLGL